MMIRVMYPDGKTEMVRPPLLNLLIKRQRIPMFVGIPLAGIRF